MSNSTRSLLVAAAVAGAGYFGFQHYAATPTYSLVQIKLAIDDRDVARFERHVDVDSIVSRAVDDMMAEQMAQTGPAPSDEFGRALGYGLAEMIKPMITSIARKEVHKSIENGDVRLGELGIEAQGPLATHFAAVMHQMGMRDDSGNSFAVQRQGKVATLHVHASPKELDQPVTLEFAMRDMGGYWRIVALSNMSALIARFENSPALDAWTPRMLR